MIYLKKTAKEFDEDYIDMMVDDHNDDIDLYENAAKIQVILQLKPLRLKLFLYYINILAQLRLL